MSKSMIKRDWLALVALLIVIYIFLYRDFSNVGMIYWSDLFPMPRGGYDVLISSWLYRGLGRANDATTGIFLVAMLGDVLNNATLAQKFFYLLPMPISGMAMYAFLKHLIKSRFGRIAVSLIYSLSPLAVWQFPGAPTILIVHAFSPIILLFLNEILEKGLGVRSVLMLSLFFGLMSSFDVEAPLFFVPFIVAAVVVDVVTKRSLKRAIMAILAISASLVLCFLLVLPTYTGWIYNILMPLYEQPSEGIAGMSIDYLILDTENYCNTARPHLYNCTYVTMLLAFLGLFIRDRKRLKVYLANMLTVAMVILFWASLVEGFGIWLLVRFPMLFVFRQHVKSILMVVPVFATMVALLIDEADGRGLFNAEHLRVCANIRLHPNLGRRLHIKSFHVRLDAGHIAVGVMLFTLLLSSVIYDLSPDSHMWQFLSGTYPLERAHELGREVEVSPAYMDVREWLESREGDGEFFRILWLPFSEDADRILSGYIPEALSGVYANSLGKLALEALCAGKGNLGRFFGLLNIKYIIVELNPKNEWQGLAEGTCRVVEWTPKYLAAGDPTNFIKTLGKQENLKLVAAEKDFWVYENTAFVPHIAAYDRIFLLAPIPSPTRLTNLISNPSFEDGWVFWRARSLKDNWSVDGSVKYSGNFSLRCDNLSTKEHMWADAMQSIPVEANTWYNISGWMKTENVEDSQVLLELYDESGSVVDVIVPQSSVFGSKDWWSFSTRFLTPPGTIRAAIELYAGWSQDGKNPGITWFDYIRFSKPADEAETLLLPQNLMYNVPGFLDFDVNRWLFLPGDLLSPDQVEGYLDICDAIVFLEDVSSNKTSNYPNVRHLVFLFQASSELVPMDGEWLVEREGFSVYGYVAKCVGSGKAVKNFYALKAGWYGMAVRLQTDGNFSVHIDGKPINISHVESNTSFGWYEASSVYLDQRMHCMEFLFNGNLTAIDQITVFSLSLSSERFIDIFRITDPSDVCAKETGPTEYEVHIKSKSPAFIVLGESYDSEWAAYLGDVRMKHFPALPFSWANGFYVNATEEEVDVRIVFERQRTRNLVIYTWIATWASIIVSIAIISAKPRLSKMRRCLKKYS